MVIVLWLGLLLLAVMLLMVHNWFGGTVVLGCGVLLYLILRFAAAGIETTVAYVVTWFLLVSGPKAVLELGSEPTDATILAGMTILWPSAWSFLWLIGTIAALLGGGAICSDLVPLMLSLIAAVITYDKGVHRLSRFACRRSPRARVPARRFSLAGVRKARPPMGSAVPAVLTARGWAPLPAPRGRCPRFAALAASSRSARSAAADSPGQHRHPAGADPGQGFFERLGLQGSSLVFRPCFAPSALVGHPGTRAPAVLADVFVPRPPDPGFELDGRVFVERGEFGRLGLGHQQPLGVAEDRYQGRIHLSSSIPPLESSG